MGTGTHIPTKRMQKQQQKLAVRAEAARRLQRRRRWVLLLYRLSFLLGVFSVFATLFFLNTPKSALFCFFSPLYFALAAWCSWWLNPKGTERYPWGKWMKYRMIHISEHSRLGIALALSALALGAGIFFLPLLFL